MHRTSLALRVALCAALGLAVAGCTDQVSPATTPTAAPQQAEGSAAPQVGWTCEDASELDLADLTISGGEGEMRALAQRCIGDPDRTDADERALGRAAQFGRVADVEYLLDLGADLTWTGPQGWSVLQWTARALQTEATPDRELDAGKAQVVSLLVNAGAQVDTRDEAGRTPLAHASLFGFHQTAIALIDAGADVNARDDNGRTPLMHAAVGSGTVDLVETLLDDGADRDMQSTDGQTAEEIARSQGRDAIADAIAAA
jgi:ankyrin repeat protein